MIALVGQLRSQVRLSRHDGLAQRRVALQVAGDGNRTPAVAMDQWSEPWFSSCCVSIESRNALGLQAEAAGTLSTLR